MRKTKFVTIFVLILVIILNMSLLCSCYYHDSNNENSQTELNDNDQTKDAVNANTIFSSIAIVLSILSIALSALLSYSNKKDSFAQLYLEFNNNGIYQKGYKIVQHYAMIDKYEPIPEEERSMINTFFIYLEMMASEYSKMKMFKIGFEQVIKTITSKDVFYLTLEEHDKQGTYKNLYKLAKKEWGKQHNSK